MTTNYILNFLRCPARVFRAFALLFISAGYGAAYCWPSVFGVWWLVGTALLWLVVRVGT